MDPVTLAVVGSSWVISYWLRSYSQPNPEVNPGVETYTRVPDKVSFIFLYSFLLYPNPPSSCTRFTTQSTYFLDYNTSHWNHYIPHTLSSAVSSQHKFQIFFPSAKYQTLKP